MTEQKLRVAQIGCGPRAPVLLEAMRTSGVIEMVGLCDHHPDKLNALGQRFGVQQRYADLRQMIETEQPDLVTIITRPEIRLPIIEAAIAAGAPAMLNEKPMSLTPSENSRLRTLGEDQLIAVNTQYQWMPHWQRFWKLLENRELGEVRLLRASTRTMILDQGPHILDLALKAARLSGLSTPQWVLATCVGEAHYGDFFVPADTAATVGLDAARLHLNAGPSAAAVPGEDVYWYQQQIEVIGERGRLWVSLNQGWQLWLEGEFSSGFTGWPQNDGEAQTALFIDLHETLTLEKRDWRSFPTRVGVAAANADVMFAGYGSSLQRDRFDLSAGFSPADVAAIEDYVLMQGNISTSRK